jgi:hypothetical protein
MKCPLCNEHELVEQSLEDISGKKPDRFCPKIIKIDGRVYNHYREVTELGRTRIIIPPYRVITEDGASLISIQSKYKTGKTYFKFFLEVPELHLDTEEKMRERIKLLILLS